MRSASVPYLLVSHPFPLITEFFHAKIAEMGVPCSPKQWLYIYIRLRYTAHCFGLKGAPNSSLFIHIPTPRSSFISFLEANGYCKACRIKNLLPKAFWIRNHHRLLRFVRSSGFANENSSALITWFYYVLFSFSYFTFIITSSA